MKIGIVLLFIAVLLIGFAYYKDYKTDKKEFKFSLQRVGLGIIIMILVFLITDLILDTINVLFQ